MKRQKNDANDAEAIVEAALRPGMRTVPAKSPEQQALAMLFRTRKLLLTQKTQLVTALRAHLAEHGVIVAGGRRSIDPFIRILDDVTNTLSHVVRKVGAIYLDRIAQTAGEIEDLERQIDEQAKEQEMAQRLRSIPGIGPVASTMLIAEMPENGTISGEEAAALTGLAPVAHDSGTLRGKRAIAGGRRSLRHVMFQAALVAAHHNPSLKSFADRLRKAGKPHKVIIIAVARKLITIANALCKNRQIWAAPAT